MTVMLGSTALTSAIQPKSPTVFTMRGRAERTNCIMYGSPRPMAWKVNLLADICVAAGQVDVDSPSIV